MLMNYLKVAFRNIVRHKLYSFITVLGLAVGMTVFILIAGYIRYEKSYDDFHIHGDHIYRVDKEISGRGEKYTRALTGASLAPLLLQEYPSIKNAARFANYFSCFIENNKKCFKEKRFLFADNSALKMFTFPLIIGNDENALAEPFTVLLTTSMAEKYFGKVNPIGKTIVLRMKELQHDYDFKITGVVKDVPSNSSIKFDFLASFQSLYSIAEGRISNTWDGPVWTYAMLDANSTPDDLKPLIPKFIKKFVPQNELVTTGLELVPLKDTYYAKADGVMVGDWGIKPISYMLLFISVLVLLIACVNFTNLLSARSVTRAREIGVRKVQGANRRQIIIQFLSESVVISLLSFVFAVCLAEILLPFFRSFISEAFPTFNILPSREIDFSIIEPSFLIPATFASIVVGLLSGFYPAMVLSKYKAAHVIKGEMRDGKSSVWFRKGLVITQFAIAVILMNCSLSILNQINHWRNYNPGFDKNNLICIPINDRSLREKYELFKNDLLQKSNIIDVTGSNVIPGGEEANMLTFSSGNIKDMRIIIYYVDYDFVKTMGLKITGGRDFSEGFTDDSKSAFLLNSKAMQICGWKEVQGQQIDLYTSENGKTNISYSGSLIGTIEDFKYRVFSSKEEPMILKIQPNKVNYILIRINEWNKKESLENIISSWNDMSIKQPFEFTYLSAEISVFPIFNAANAVIRFAAFISIIIAVMGLFALTSFVIERSTKEIGIRKVMGASVKDIAYKFSKSFVALVIIANLIGITFSYQIVGLMLQNLPNHTNINLWLLLRTSVLIISLSIVITVLRSIKAATTNPVESLRCE